MEVAFRYEGFDDAALADRFQTWSVKNRYSFGGRYTAYEKDPVVVYFVLEYRGTQYRLAPEQRATLDEFNNEVRLRLGLDY